MKFFLIMLVFTSSNMAKLEISTSIAGFNDLKLCQQEQLHLTIATPYFNNKTQFICAESNEANSNGREKSK